jgi:AAA domain/FaeA-like protein
MFKITNFVEFDPKGRAICPFCFSEGKTDKNLSLVPNTDGAFKCFRGHTPEQIREALGQPKDQQVPAALAPKQVPAHNILISVEKVVEACDRLMNSKEAMEWLEARGITADLTFHFQLGLCRAKCGDKHLSSIGIPLPADINGENFYFKKRVAPWLSKAEQPVGYKKWSQYGIPSMLWFTHQPKNPKQTWIVAGEWDAMMLGWAMKDQEDIAIVTFTTGEGNIPKDQDELAKLKGELITFYDLDSAGASGSQKIQSTFGDRCRVATVPAPQKPKEGFDVSDSLNAGFTPSDFIEAAAQAKSYCPPKKENSLRSRLVSNRDLYDRAPDYVEFLVPDLLTEDELFVLAGPPRGGKSLLAMTLSKAVATGGRFLDRPVMQGSVIYVNCEDSEAKVKQRMIAQQWDPDLPVYWMDKFKLSELPHLIEVAREMDDLRLIVLDTLSRIRDDSASESAAELGRVLEPLQEMAKELKVCIVIAHHTGKIGDKEMIDPFDLIRGSGAIRATCRGAIVIAPGDNCFRLIAENGHSEKLDVKIRINPDDWEWKLLGKWSPKAVTETFRDQVLEHLNRVAESTISEIAKALQISANVVKTTLWRLQADDMVTKQGGRKGCPATYGRSHNKVTLPSLLPKQNPVTSSLLGYTVTNNLLTTTTEKVIIDGKVIIDDSSMITFDSDDHFSLLPVTVTTSGCNPVPVKDLLGNTANDVTEYEPGSEKSDHWVPGLKVIIGKGRFYGMPAEIISIDADGQVEVRAKGWAISRTYPPDQLRLISDSGEQS